MKQQISVKPKRPRNHLTSHPLMRKGGVHQKTKKAERKATKQALRCEYPVESTSFTQHNGFKLAFDRVFPTYCSTNLVNRRGQFLAS
jgi:hypothetical protein